MLKSGNALVVSIKCATFAPDLETKYSINNLIKERKLIMAKQEKIDAVKSLALEHYGFTIPDNCQGDGWDGTLHNNGAYCFGNNHFEGEFFNYEDMDEDLLDTILDEAEFND